MAKGQAHDKATGRFLPKTAKVKGAKETMAKSPATPRIFLEVRLGFRVYCMASYFLCFTIVDHFVCCCATLLSTPI
jgi:hypothetical protein